MSARACVCVCGVSCRLFSRIKWSPSGASYIICSKRQSVELGGRGGRMAGHRDRLVLYSPGQLGMETRW